MKKICEKCGEEFEVPENVWLRPARKYCDKHGFKYGLPTQEELAKKAGRDFVDKVQIDSDKADIEGISYGMYMARKGHGK